MSILARIRESVASSIVAIPYLLALGTLSLLGVEVRALVLETDSHLKAIRLQGITLASGLVVIILGLTTWIYLLHLWSAGIIGTGTIGLCATLVVAFLSHRSRISELQKDKAKLESDLAREKKDRKKSQTETKK
jgi:hypothetical protein